MTGPNLADQLADLARRLARLAPDRRDPERYHCDKSELIAALRSLAKQAEQSPHPRPYPK